MTETTGAPNTAREKLWAKETAESWNISTRVLLIVGLKGSFFDEKNPRLELLRKLEEIIEHEDLKGFEVSGTKARNASELRALAGNYNTRYRELFLESFKASELRTLAIDSNCVLIPSRELENSVRH